LCKSARGTIDEGHGAIGEGRDNVGEGHDDIDVDHDVEDGGGVLAGVITRFLAAFPGMQVS